MRVFHHAGRGGQQARGLLIERRTSLEAVNKSRAIALLIALFLILVGARAALIDYAGNPSSSMNGTAPARSS